MKKIFFLLILFTGVYPLYITAQSNYDHKVIAVLPVRAMFAEYRNLPDSSMEAFKALEIKYGIQLQEALYQAITSDTNRLLVEVQPWQTTDSILRRAGLDLRKTPYLDMSAIAKILKVDACITTIVTLLSSRGDIGAISTPALWPIGLAVSEGLNHATRAIKRNNKIFTFRLMDGKSGDEVWNYSQQVTAGEVTLDKDQLVFSPLLFKRFRKRFPYCD